MTDYEFHEPTFYGTTEERWEEPSREALPDQPAAAAGHFLLSASGFPPESVEDLALPVVDAEGDLNRHALADAVTGPDSVASLDASDRIERRVEETVADLEAEQFPEGDEGVSTEVAAEHEGPPEEQHEHEVEQKLHTDDEAREYAAEEALDDEDRPEKGR